MVSGKLGSILKFGALLLLAVMLSTSFQVPQVAQAAAGEVAILDTTVSGGLGSVEALKVVAAGKTPVLKTAAQWALMSTADFADYDALVLGDATCTSVAAVAAAEANVAVWSPAITGNVLINGTDPVFHDVQGGNQLTESGIAFAVADPGETGLYASLSCYYDGAGPGTPVPVLSGLGAFTVASMSCHNDSHILVAHPALAGTTDASLSSWSCSVHEGFDSYPASFLELAIAEDTGGTPLPGSKSFPDGTTGVPYILVRGEGIEICGDGIDNDGDGAIDEGCPPPPNTGPDCDGATADPSLLWPPNHKFVPITITVTDSDGDPVTVTVTSIRQDEPVKVKGSGNTSPDGKGVGTATAEVRAERTGDPKIPGDGRVYHIGFTASDGIDVCSGVALVGVPHDQGGANIPIDGGPLYDSTTP